MMTKGQKKGSVRFSLKQDGAKKVQLAGDFSDWKQLPMRKQKDGSFAINVELRLGSYEYKFVVDGQWMVDPDNGAWALNPFGTMNSLAVCE